MNIELDKLVKDQYVPSEIERKKAVMMYFFVGILPAMAGRKITTYELFHLKQALGWWFTFFIFLVLTCFFWFIPFVRVVPFLFFIGLLVVWIIFIKQAWEGRYFIKEDNILLPFFYSIGSWMLNLFDVKFDRKKDL